VVQHQPSVLQKSPPGGAPPAPVEVVLLVVVLEVLPVVVLAEVEAGAPPAPPVDADVEAGAPPEPPVWPPEVPVEGWDPLPPHPVAAAETLARRRQVWNARMTGPRARR
jgi:hypothetical protein